MKFQHYIISFYDGSYCQLKKSVFNIDIDEESVTKIPCLQILIANDFKDEIPESILSNLNQNINEVSEETFEEILFILANVDKDFRDRILEVIELGV